jgi:hypothetical protein
MSDNSKKILGLSFINRMRAKRRAAEVTLKDLTKFFFNKNGFGVSQGFISMLESGYPASQDTLKKYGDAVEKAITEKKTTKIK